MKNVTGIWPDGSVFMTHESISNKQGRESKRVRDKKEPHENFSVTHSHWRCIPFPVNGLWVNYIYVFRHKIVFSGTIIKKICLPNQWMNQKNKHKYIHKISKKCQ